MAVHPANLNATPAQKAIRYAARLSRLHQAIAQHAHACPVEDLHAEIAHLEGQLEAMGHQVPKSHEEAAALWVQLDPQNPHAHHQAAHNVHGHRIPPQEV